MDELSSACTKLGDQTTPKPLRLVNQERRCSKDRMLQPSSPPVTAAPGTPEGTRPGNNCPPSSGQRLRPQPHLGAPAGNSGQGSAGHGPRAQGHGEDLASESQTPAPSPTQKSLTPLPGGAWFSVMNTHLWTSRPAGLGHKNSCTPCPPQPAASSAEPLRGIEKLCPGLASSECPLTKTERSAFRVVHLFRSRDSAP